MVSLVFVDCVLSNAYPYLEPEDIDETLAYAAALADEEVIELAK